VTLQQPQPPAKFFSEWRIIGLILLIGLGLRVGMLHRFWSDLNTDPDVYVAIAQGLAEGRGYSAPGTDVPTVFRPPLYPLFLVPVSGPDQQWGRAVLQLLLSLATLPFIWLTARRLHLSRTGRLLAVTIVAIDPLLLRYVPYPMTETLCALLISILLWSLSRQGPATLRHGFLAGLIIGFCVLSRPTFWAFGILLTFAVIWNRWRDRSFTTQAMAKSGSPAFSNSWGSLLAMGIGIAVCVVPWGVRNLMVMGTPILMTTHGGYTLLLGNNEAFYEEVVRQPFGTIWDGSHGAGQDAWVKQLEQEMRSKGIRGEVERDRWMSARAKETIRRNPDTFLKACWIKFYWFWNIAPHGSASHALPPVARFGVGLYYTALWLTLITGIVFVLKNLWRDERSFRIWQAPLLLVIAMTLAHLVYWSDGRMRAPIMPAIALLAAAIAGFDKTRKSDPREGQGLSP